MDFSVRPINGTLGSAIAVSDGAGEEHKLAVFADGGIRDFALFGNGQCVLISRKRGIAIVDLAAREIVKRGILPRPVDRIVVAGDGARALAYHCNPGLLAFIDLASLASTAEFNLIQSRDDGMFDLLHRDDETLREAGTSWHSIPFSDGPLRGEVDADSLFLSRAPEEPSGLRRMQFTRSARAVFRADGKVVLPFEFRVNGPGWVTGTGHAKPITMSAHVISVGIAVIDEANAQAEMHVVRKKAEKSVHTMFPVRSISPDGTRAILQSYDPLTYSAEPEAPVAGGVLRRIFGRKGGGKLAFGLEQWDVAGEPRLETALPFRSLDADTLRPVDTQRFSGTQLEEARKEIGLIFDGVEAGYHDRHDEWLSSQAKRKTDAYFDPLEARTAPSWNPPFERVHYPPLFAEAAQRLVRLNPKPISALPWDRMADREKRLMAAFLSGWSKHADQAADSVSWTDNDRFVVLSRDGKVGEVSVDGCVGQIYQLVDSEKQVWPYSSNSDFSIELHHLRDRSYAVEVMNIRLEFELPSFVKAGPGDPSRATPLFYREAIGRAERSDEVKQVDRLTEKIRRGYIKIAAKDVASVIAGLHALTREVRDHLDEIVVDNRWIPTLYHRGKPVTEAEFCHILSEDGSAAEAQALDGLLTTFLDVTEGQREAVWHPDDTTPTMGPVSLALVALCDPLPPSVARFYARRDMDHDMWTSEAFSRLDLPQDRFLAPDLVALQIRLAIQDIATGNVDADIFALYRLKLVRDALHADPALASELADMIVDQAEAQAPDFSWGSAAGAPGIVNAIAGSIGRSTASEAGLAAALLRRVEGQLAR